MRVPFYFYALLLVVRACHGLSNYFPRERRVAIIGAGPAGLAAAFRLSREPGINVTVFEASPFLGGRTGYTVEGERRNDFAWLGQPGGETEALADLLGIDVDYKPDFDVFSDRGRAILSDGSLVGAWTWRQEFLQKLVSIFASNVNSYRSLAMGAMLGGSWYGLVQHPDRLKDLAIDILAQTTIKYRHRSTAKAYFHDVMSSVSQGSDAPWSSSLGSLTLQEFVMEYLEPAFAELFLDLFTQFTMAGYGHPADIPAWQGLMISWEITFGGRNRPCCKYYNAGTIQRLLWAVANALPPGAIQLNTTVEEVGRHAAGVRLNFGHGKEETFDSVVVAAPPGSVALSDPSPLERRLLSNVVTNPYTVVVCEVNATLHVHQAFTIDSALRQRGDMGGVFLVTATEQPNRYLFFQYGNANMEENARVAMDALQPGGAHDIRVISHETYPFSARFQDASIVAALDNQEGNGGLYYASTVDSVDLIETSLRRGREIAERYILGMQDKQSEYVHQSMAYFWSFLTGEVMPLHTGSSFVADILCKTSSDGCVTADGPLDSHWELTYEGVTSRLARIPAEYASGDIAKANDLGRFVIDDQLWSDDPYLKTLALGFPKKEHQWVRPIVDRIMGSGSPAWDENRLYELVARYLSQRVADFDTLGDSARLTVTVLHEAFLGIQLTPQHWQTKLLPVALLPKEMTLDYANDGVANLRRVRRRLLAKYTAVLQRAWEENPAELPLRTIVAAQGIQWNDRTQHILAHEFLDAFAFAGGLSIRVAIQTGLALLHDEGSPMAAHRDSLHAGDAEQFAWEVLRSFPLVQGFAFRDPSTKRRTVLSLRAALRDKTVWGQDSDTFKLRSLSLYKAHGGVAWAEGANSEEAALRPHSRGCPAKSFGIAMLKAFFGQWFEQRQEYRVASGSVDFAAPSQFWTLLLTRRPPEDSELGIHFFEADRVAEVLPAAPRDYPDAMRGLFWMDQRGAFGVSNHCVDADIWKGNAANCGVTASAVFSFGDPRYPLDRETRTISINTTGPAWSYHNDATFYERCLKFRSVPVPHYKFTWAEDYSSFQIAIESIHASQDKMTALVYNVSAEVPPAPREGECPPSSSFLNNRSAASRCATFHRTTATLFGNLRYDVFRIVDGDGKPVQPYYDAYLRWARHVCRPDAVAASRLGLLSRSTGVGNSSACMFIGLA